MGVLQRFERRLEDAIEGAFARVFGGAVQPAEVAAALQREGEQRKLLVSAGRTLVPNDYVVELGASDAERLEAYDLPLRRELGAMIGEHAVEQGWSFVGPVAVRFERVADLRTGMFRVRSAVVVAAVEPAPRGGGDPLPAPLPAPVPLAVPAAVPAAVPVVDSPPLLVLGDRRMPIDAAVLVIGRGVEADLRLMDTGVSRRHAELRRAPDGSVLLVDTGSTNGTQVNDQPVLEISLTDGDRITVGSTTLTFQTTTDRHLGPPAATSGTPEGEL